MNHSGLGELAATGALHAKCFRCVKGPLVARGWEVAKQSTNKQVKAKQCLVQGQLADPRRRAFRQGGMMLMIKISQARRGKRHRFRSGHGDPRSLGGFHEILEISGQSVTFIPPGEAGVGVIDG